MLHTLTNKNRRWTQAIEHGVHKTQNKYIFTSLLALATSTPGGWDVISAKYVYDGISFSCDDSVGMSKEKPHSNFYVIVIWGRLRL